jgi:hypothetical protein
MARPIKHRWSVAHNFLSGMTVSDWSQLLRDNRGAIDPIYWHRAAFISLLSVLKSADVSKEERRFGKAIEATQVAPPLFILGHWRSGTTHLHYLLWQDTRQFACPNNFQVFNPRNFLSTEDAYVRRYAWLCPSKRPMDNMALSFRTPQEDEIAVALVSLRSPEFSNTFPRLRRHFDRYLTFQDVPPEELEEWKRAFLWFLKKVTLKERRQLVLKSPAHTARIRLLLELFPEARFVHIHRNPYTLFQSLQHYYHTAAWLNYLQCPEAGRAEERILRRYNTLYDPFFEQRSLIPRGHFHDMSFEALEADPVGQMRELYTQLGLEGFEEFQPKLRAYLESIAGYQKNRVPDLTATQRERVASAWCRSFEEWDYPY